MISQLDSTITPASDLTLKMHEQQIILRASCIIVIFHSVFCFIALFYLVRPSVTQGTKPHLKVLVSSFPLPDCVNQKCTALLPSLPHITPPFFPPVFLQF